MTTSTETRTSTATAMRQNEPKTPKSVIDPSKKRKNETITVFSSDPKTTTPIETFLGALTVSSFLIIWFASILSPVILGVAIYHEYYKLATSLIALSIVAYLPWEIKPLQNFYDEYHTSYYDGVDIVFEGGDIPPSNETDSSNNNNNHDNQPSRLPQHPPTPHPPHLHPPTRQPPPLPHPQRPPPILPHDPRLHLLPHPLRPLPLPPLPQPPPQLHPPPHRRTQIGFRIEGVALSRGRGGQFLRFVVSE
mmetsp:Transcript_28799/g.59100  ORF Transcript_28799/g.59100 Transcript_28799/m.59100 type:complete len:249 (+) Transcript_28799:274-1020(+)